MECQLFTYIVTIEKVLRSQNVQQICLQVSFWRATTHTLHISDL